jgi:nucleotide-binding universal stress UspA family protein
MHQTILLAAALQQWDRHSAHALAARDVAATLARQAKQLHVLSVYSYDVRVPSTGLSAEMAAKLREQEIEQTDSLMARKMDEYVAPLAGQGLPISTILRVGSARHVIVEVASEVGADLLIIGSHSRRGLFDVVLGGTAQHVARHAPCAVVLVSPGKSRPDRAA